MANFGFGVSRKKALAETIPNLVSRTRLVGWNERYGRTFEIEMLADGWNGELVSLQVMVSGGNLEGFVRRFEELNGKLVFKRLYKINRDSRCGLMMTFIGYERQNTK